MGNVAKVCLADGDAWKGVDVNCAAAGLICTAGAKQKLGCEVDPAKTCNESTFVERCEGTVRVQCQGGLEDAGDCAWSGKTCIVDSTSSKPQARCTWGEGCSGQTECNGDRLEYCEAGQRVSLDCATFGMTCEKSSSQCFLSK